MAIDLSNFEKTKYPNLWKSKIEDKSKGYKYLMWININGKLHKKIIGYSEKDKLTDKKAKDKLEDIRRDIENGYTISNKTKLTDAFKRHLETLPNTNWTKHQYTIYKLYIEKEIGGKAVSEIKPSDIKRIIAKMDKAEYKKTTQKKILSVLKPFFKALMQDKVIKEDPSIYITVKLDSTKKPVTNATALYGKIFKGIQAYFKDNPFYQSLFLFVMFGRRKDEVLSLKWKNIDLENNYYWIENTKNNDSQQYPLPLVIKEQLQQIKDTKRGLVFKSPITGNKLHDVKRQVNQLKKYLNMPNFQFHYMRNVLVSMLAENQMEAITLSGILGHRDVNTINKYLSINHYKSGQDGLTKINQVLDIEVL